MEVSAFRVVAVGVAAANLELGSRELRVTPTEWLSKRDGELKDGPESMTYKSKDAQGIETQGGMLINNAIPATWMPYGSNRLTPPNVRRGERLELLQAADSAELYWRSQGLDDHLRLLETIIFGISAHTKEQTSAETPNKLDTDNMYWFEFSSHSKKLAFQSSKANGEPYRYEMFFDFNSGEFAVTDDIGNFFHMVSKLHLIHAQNTDGTFFKLDKKNIEAYAPVDINAQADKNVSITAGENMNLTAAKNLTAKGGVQAMLDGGGSVLTLTAGSSILKTPAFDIQTG